MACCSAGTSASLCQTNNILVDGHYSRIINSKPEYIMAHSLQAISLLAKLGAYHLHVQLGFIALGLLQWMALSSPKLVWRRFGSWLRTMNVEAHPSELVVVTAMRNTISEFLIGLPSGHKLAKFLKDKIDFERMPSWRAAS